MICATPITKGPAPDGPPPAPPPATAATSKRVNPPATPAPPPGGPARPAAETPDLNAPGPNRSGWLIDEDDWRAEAACWGVDSDLFFLEPHQSADPAREICATCTVTDACLDYALRNRITVGVWGGKTLKERQRLTRQRKDLL